MQFYYVDKEYINYLRKKESKIPNIEYSNRDKFVCGKVLSVGDINYYVPVSHFNKKLQTNFPIKLNDEIIATLQFKFMFPAPDEAVKRVDFKEISSSDVKYADLLYKEYDYCKKHKDDIYKKAEYVYYKIGGNEKHYLYDKCCNFKLLEELYKEYESKKEKNKEKESQEKIQDEIKESKNEAAVANQEEQEKEISEEKTKEKIAAAEASQEEVAAADVSQEEGTAEEDFKENDNELFEFYKKDISQAGYTPKKDIIEWFIVLSNKVGHKVSIKELHTMYKNLHDIENDTAKLVNSIADEFKKEELQKINEIKMNIDKTPEP